MADHLLRAVGYHFNLAMRLATSPVGGLLGHASQTQNYAFIGFMGFAVQLHQLVHDFGELHYFGLSVFQDGFSFFGVGDDVSGEHFNIGAQAGERRSELVAGIGYELLLLLTGLVEGGRASC